MLELKSYQQRALDELSNYLTNVNSLNRGSRGIRLAYVDQVGDEVGRYKPISGLEDVPFVCIKIPTGGGKTLVAANSLSVIHENYVPDKNGKGLVLWFVPSDAIRSQTLKTLNDRNHPYRELLDAKFDNKVAIFTIEEALSIQKSDIQENLCIVVASLASFRRIEPLWLKTFQANGALLTHFENLVEDTDFLEKDEEGTIIYSLANVIKINNPVVIVDEGHNAQTALSFEMLQKLNPSFILEFTATPRSESNVIVKVLASELKAEKMVKIPIYLDNLTQWQEAIRDGITQREKLADLARKEKRETKEYIRPIVLLQAEQEIESEKKIYVNKIRDFLLAEMHIPEGQIARKTAKQDEIKDINLLDPDCPINYIITVNALREGWDCPFAYVLVSVANIGATIAVEQTIGRILRLPQAKEKKNLDLNYAYIYTSSESFSKASSSVIKGLEENGYSRADLRENTGKITPEKEDFERYIHDDTILVPYMGIDGKDEPLAFNTDLVGEDFRIYDHFTPIRINFHDDQNQRVKIDITEQNGWFRITQGKLSIILHPEDFSKEELGNWLKRNIRHSTISAEEMGKYIDLILGDMLAVYQLNELSLNRFRLKEKIHETIIDTIQAYTKQQFNVLLSDHTLATDVSFYTPENTILIARVSPESFQKHLFEKAGAMNGEETELAFRIDALDNILWWYRNREKEDFYLQGWKQGKFYPDFILKTRGGVYILVEYKGEDRLTNEDTEYKEALGHTWEQVSDGENKFFLASKKNSDEILKEISAIK